MMRVTKSKKKYTEEWGYYISPLYALTFTPNEKLGLEVKQTLDKLKDLMKKVAEDKFRKVI
jgi:hypothetical protein